MITGNNRVTLAALHALRRARPPRWGSSATTTSSSPTSIDPPVTVVHQDPAAIGQKAAHQLFARLLGDESPPQTVVMPTRLIVRASGRLLAPGARRR